MIYKYCDHDGLVWPGFAHSETINKATSIYGANHGHHGGHNYVTASPENVDGQLHTLHTHFGQHLCLDLLLVDCSKHPISGDEVICGSDGLEYKNQ
ncbi:hypothetical protein KUTeg_010333 [Tegillarca granosa]|uniref:Uncharacterized protein n=1 Tax=Tegillarca granosa TaxID=220873 RepID=A0ABQ9FBD9_TEGGR|nr:hypothetical protein KUTeg_010333 [Tegillarca granosa]